MHQKIISCYNYHTFPFDIDNLLFILQVTQLEEEAVPEILLTRNSLPLNPLLLLVSINTYS